MSEVDKKALKGLDPNATIQIDQIGGLDQVELIDESEPAQCAPAAGARQGPPALPPTASMAAPTAAGQPRTGRTIAYVAVVGVIVVAAMAAGLLVGNRVRGGGTAAVPSASVAPAAPGPAQSASTLVLPTVEIGKH
jgi:hypothetical protein